MGRRWRKGADSFWERTGGMRHSGKRGGQVYPSAVDGAWIANGWTGRDIDEELYDRVSSSDAAKRRVERFLGRR